MVPKRRIRSRMDFRENTLYISDCLNLLKYWNKRGASNKIDLIYIDPPFNSKKNYNIILNPHDIQLHENAFEDTWSLVDYSDCLDEIRKLGYNDLYLLIEGLKTAKIPHSYIAYLSHMAVRVIFMRKMLKDTGSFYYHCDPTMSHYVKMILDCIFGINNYRNEIVWCYKSGGVSKRYFPKKHDIIFLYTKTDEYKFNPQKELKTSKEMERALRLHPEEFFDDDDGNGMYTWYYRPGHEKYPNGLKQYVEAYVRDYWAIPALTNTANERLGYPTQKPEELIERIILTSSDEGDLVVDFFMGGGTTLAVSKKNNRNFIGCDINLRAVELTSNRLNEIRKPPLHYLSGIPSSSKQLIRYLKNFTPSRGGFELEDLVIKIYLSDLTLKKYQFPVVSQPKNRVGYDGEFIFEYKGQVKRGLVQVTSHHGYQHFGSFCNIVNQENADLGIYITFESNITKNMKVAANNSENVGGCKRIQFLTLEELIDSKNVFDIPLDVLQI